MKTFFQIFGGTLILLGLMAAAGSAGDCDGKCGPGNDLATMMIIIAGSMMAMGLGGVMLVIAGKNN